jgi:hypothetical protein
MNDKEQFKSAHNCLNKIIFLSKYLILGKLRYTDCTTTFILGAIPTCGKYNVDDFSIANIQNKTTCGVDMGVIFLTWERYTMTNNVHLESRYLKQSAVIWSQPPKALQKLSYDNVCPSLYKPTYQSAFYANMKWCNGVTLWKWLTILCQTLTSVHM